MTRDEIIQIAAKHGFGGFEVGNRLIGLINEIIEMIKRQQDGQSA